MKPRLLVLQASSLCNLDCAYCYVPNRQDASVMSEATLRAALGLALSRHAPGDPLRILWHAGEPLAIGLAFFERASAIIRELTPPGVRVGQSMQTNATLVDEAWCRFFARERILVGVSVDGPAALHDRQRPSLGGAPTHARVERGLALLRQHGIPLHGLMVLTPRSLALADEIFDYFAGAGFASLAFNLEETEGPHASTLGDGTRYAERYRAFMTRLFDRWQAAGRRPRIRELDRMTAAIGAFLDDANFTRGTDDLVPLRNLAVTREGELSTFSPELAGGTPSDPRRFSLGNVHQVGSLDALEAGARLRDQAREIDRGIERCRAGCDYFAICGGGTASNKFYERGTFDCAETMSCALHRKALADVVADRLRRLSAPPA